MINISESDNCAQAFPQYLAVIHVNLDLSNCVTNYEENAGARQYFRKKIIITRS